jgi:PEP-CTERM motif
MKLFCTFLLAIVALSIPSPSWSGTVRIDGMKKNSQAAIKTYGENGKIISTITINDTDGDGKAAVEITQQDKIKKIVIFKLDINGKRQIENGKFTATSLLQTEPFMLPSFLAVDPALSVLASFDVEAFLAQINPFTPGQFVSVTDGAIAQTAAIVFKDPTGLGFPPDEPFDVATLDSLPNYTGSVMAGPLTQFVPIPEPGTLALVGLGLMGAMLGSRLRAGRSNKPNTPMP